MDNNKHAQISTEAILRLSVKFLAQTVIHYHTMMVFASGELSGETVLMCRLV